MDKERTEIVRRIIAAVLFVAAGIVYVATVGEKTNYQEFPTSKAFEEVSTEAYTQSEMTADLLDRSNEPVITPLLVDINSAGTDELMLLPGIGEKKAEAIIDYRESQGDFSKEEDIMLVPGIKDGIFNKIKAFIYVDEEVSDAQENTGG